MSPCLEFRTKKDKNKQRWSIRVGTSPDPNSFRGDYLLLKRYYCFKIIHILLHIIIIVIISPFLLNRNSLQKCLVMILSKAFLLSHKIKIYPIHKNTDAHLSIEIYHFYFIPIIHQLEGFPFIPAAITLQSLPLSSLKRIQISAFGQGPRRQSKKKKYLQE